MPAKTTQASLVNGKATFKMEPGGLQGKEDF